jgi:hypothetical protein
MSKITQTENNWNHEIHERHERKVLFGNLCGFLFKHAIHIYATEFSFI